MVKCISHLPPVMDKVPALSVPEKPTSLVMKIVPPDAATGGQSLNNQTRSKRVVCSWHEADTRWMLRRFIPKSAREKKDLGVSVRYPSP